MGKILITGPGRSGTTFIVQMLTRLGFDTGFRPGEESYAESIRAGCEWTVDVDLERDSAQHIAEVMKTGPRVLKSPEWGMILKGLLTLGLIEVDHVVIPIRDIDVAAKSRIDAGLHWWVDKSLSGDALIEDQASIMALALGRAIEACMLFSVPCTVMLFPHLVKNEAYCYRKLSALGKIDRGEHTKVFNELANPEQIKWK
jgi:hypothetical protein